MLCKMELPMEIEILNKTDPACEAFVVQNPNGRICHLPVWSDVVLRATGHRPFYLVAGVGSRIRGILPLMQIRSSQ